MGNIDRIRAALAIADDPRSNANEADTARRIAERMMAAGGFTAADLEADESGVPPWETVADEEGFARARGIAHLPTWPARTALLAALATPAPVPADLAALLTECAGAGWPWLVDGPNGDAYAVIEHRHIKATEALCRWVAATLPPLATGGA